MSKGREFFKKNKIKKECQWITIKLITTYFIGHSIVCTGETQLARTLEIGFVRPVSRLGQGYSDSL